MASNWLVCVDDSVWASYAFNFAMTYLNKETDRVFLLHVTEEPARVFVGYATASLIQGTDISFMKINIIIITSYSVFIFIP